MGRIPLSGKISILGTSGTASSITQEVDGAIPGSRSLHELGEDSGRISGSNVSMNGFRGFTNTYYVGFDSQGGIRLTDIGDNVISVSITATAQACSSYINCQPSVPGEAEISYKLNSYEVLYAQRSCLNDTCYTQTDTASLIIDKDTSTNVDYNVNNVTEYCGDSWGQVTLTINSVSKISGIGNIYIDTGSQTWVR